MPDVVIVRSRKLESKSLGVEINNNLFVPWVTSTNEKQGFIRNLLSKINGGVCIRNGVNQFGKD